MTVRRATAADAAWITLLVESVYDELVADFGECPQYKEPGNWSRWIGAAGHVVVVDDPDQGVCLMVPAAGNQILFVAASKRLTPELRVASTAAMFRFLQVGLPRGATLQGVVKKGGRIDQFLGAKVGVRQDVRGGTSVLLRGTADEVEKATR